MTQYDSIIVDLLDYLALPEDELPMIAQWLEARGYRGESAEQLGTEYMKACDI